MSAFLRILAAALLALGLHVPFAALPAPGLAEEHLQEEGGGEGGGERAGAEPLSRRGSEPRRARVAPADSAPHAPTARPDGPRLPRSPRGPAPPGAAARHLPLRC